MQTSNDNSALMPALQEAWSAGYQQAVDTLRDFAEETQHEQVKLLVSQLAKLLEAVRP